MATLVYKMTHSGDPDRKRRLWGCHNCMGRVRGYDYIAVIAIGGSTWWRNEDSRAGEIVWIGMCPKKNDVGMTGPEVTFSHFRYFENGELMLKKIAPHLERAMRKRRFKLHGFGPIQTKEIENILGLARKTKESASAPEKLQITRLMKNRCR